MSTEEKPGKEGATPPPKKPEVEPEEYPLREAPAPPEKMEPIKPWPEVEPGGGGWPERH